MAKELYSEVVQIFIGTQKPSLFFGQLITMSGVFGG